ncbi:uncharacterized protein [Battus philenor]|uniref:uncharacterized protein n=1 Tax=Battus philenor TaxID=42288 RepID=UPI0035D083FA
MVQVLSGHGCFGKYLCHIGREHSTICHLCGIEEDTTQHTLEECTAWEACTENSPILWGMTSRHRALVQNEQSWSVCITFCEIMMSQKKAAEREGEKEHLNSPSAVEGLDVGGCYTAPFSNRLRMALAEESG